jgi:hypothetical protein
MTYLKNVDTKWQPAVIGKLCTVLNRVEVWPQDLIVGNIFSDMQLWEIPVKRSEIRLIAAWTEAAFEHPEFRSSLTLLPLLRWAWWTADRLVNTKARPPKYKSVVLRTELTSSATQISYVVEFLASVRAIVHALIYYF